MAPTSYLGVRLRLHLFLLWTCLGSSCPPGGLRPPLGILRHAHQQRPGREPEGSDLQQAHGQHRRRLQPGHRSLPLPRPRRILLFLLNGKISQEDAVCDSSEERRRGAGNGLWWLPQERAEGPESKRDDQLEGAGHCVAALAAESSVCFVQQRRPLHHLLRLPRLPWHLPVQLPDEPPASRSVLS